MRTVLDCGCVITAEGRAWCPSCLDPPKPVPKAMPEETRRLVEAVRQIADWMSDHRRRMLPETTIIDRWADQLRDALPKEGE